VRAARRYVRKGGVTVFVGGSFETVLPTLRSVFDAPWKAGGETRDTFLPSAAAESGVLFGAVAGKKQLEFKALLLGNVPPEDAYWCTEKGGCGVAVHR
jgi:hypothetical protein